MTATDTPSTSTTDSNRLRALTRPPANSLHSGERTFIERVSIDSHLALQQHRGYQQALRELGLIVDQLPPDTALPDAPFVEDTMIVVDELAIRCSMGAPSRRDEVDTVAAYFQDIRTIVDMPAEARLDGGDVLQIDRLLLVGQSSRSNLHGLEALREILQPLGYTIKGVNVHGCLHLKTACTALPDRSLLLNPAWIDVTSLDDFRLIPVPPSEPMAACQLSIGQTVLLDAAHHQTAQRLHELGFSTLPLQLSEFAKAEAGPTCLSIIYQA